MKIASKIDIEYENTKNLMKALFKGVTEGFNEHMNKINSKSHDKLLRYNENNKGFWTGMYSTLDETKSTSMKIEEDAAVFEWGLSKKNLDIDMGFDFLRSGYLSFGGYNAKPVGTVKDVLPGIKNDNNID